MARAGTTHRAARSACYALQELFLDPDDYPVPPVVARGISLDSYGLVDKDAMPNIEGTRCVFVRWRRGCRTSRSPNTPSTRSGCAVCIPLRELEPARLPRRPPRRSNNFRMPKDPSNPRVFAIDPGIAFGGVFYNFFTWHFNETRTSGLPSSSIDRLRRVSRETLSSLGVLGELRADPAGVLRAVTPGENLDPQVGTRVVPGRIQFGLTVDEMDAVATRLQELLARIDAGELGVF